MSNEYSLQLTDNWKCTDVQKDWETSQKASLNPSQKVTKI